MNKILVVTRCSACPFFEDNPVKKLGGILATVLMPDSVLGVCNILPSDEYVPIEDLTIGLPPGPEREAEAPRLAKARSRRVIQDKRTVPDDCPLRRNDWTVTVAGGH